MQNLVGRCHQAGRLRLSEGEHWPLHFNAVYYGDAVNLDEFLHRKLVSPDRAERNQCTLSSVAAGAITSSQKGQIPPSRRRVLQEASELRLAEWQTASPFTESVGAAKTFREKTMLSLCHDIAHPNHDRDYRSLSIFLAPGLRKTSLALRIFGILPAGSGDAIPQIDILGSLGEGRTNGFADLLSTGGHMSWLQFANETLPRDSANWLGNLSDFVAVHPRLDASEVSDSEKWDIDSTPWLTCRQCRRGEKGPITPVFFYNSNKLTSNYPSAIILENSRTGSYPCPDDPKLDPINDLYPIRGENWRDTTEPSGCVDGFWEAASQPFSFLHARRTAEFGNAAIRHYGALHLGLRAIQEPKMAEQHTLVTDDRAHLAAYPELCTDISELHHLDDISKFRGPSPGSFMVRGLPRNTSGRDFMISKMWHLVSEGKMFLCASKGIPLGAEFFCSPTTTIAKKLPD